MKTLKLGLRNTTVPELIQKARTLVARMDGNTLFSSPKPALAEITAAAAALENAYEDAHDGTKADKIRLRERESELIGFVKQLGAYVQSASGGEAEVILSSGFELKRETTTRVPASNPAHVRGKATIHAGEVIIRWDAASGAKSYVAEMSTDGINWKACGMTTSRKLTVSGLEGGSKPLFRVAGVGPLGQSGWSEPGAVRVD